MSRRSTASAYQSNNAVTNSILVLKENLCPGIVISLRSHPPILLALGNDISIKAIPNIVKIDY